MIIIKYSIILLIVGGKMEYLDIYNDNHELLGVCEKKLAHKLGMWHDVFTCQIINPKNKNSDISN